MKKKLSALVLAFCLVTTLALAQEAPPPRGMPRLPVSRTPLVEPRDPMPPSQQLQGVAAIIDGEKLRIDKTDLRLFGVVPPQLAASFGPQARAALDSLANGQSVSCYIRDRDRDGRLLATCHNAAGNDMALELLKRGLAVAARGSIADTDIALSYLGAEQTAQSQKIGLWSVSGAPATLATPAPHTESSVALPPKLETKIPPRTESAAEVPPTTEMQTQAKLAADLLTQHTQEQAKAQARLDDAAWATGGDVGFLERYQILVSCLLMLAIGIGILSVLHRQRRQDKRDELKGLAAALRGELLGARGVCLGRLKSIATDADDKAASWPRLRSTLYQAYVGRLGHLGAELARHVSSLYGQASDYAALYNPAAATPHPQPKKQALENLVKHMDEILPRLFLIEQTGQLAPRQTPGVRAAARQQRPVTASLAATSRARPPMRISMPPRSATAAAPTGTAVVTSSVVPPLKDGAVC